MTFTLKNVFKPIPEKLLKFEETFKSPIIKTLIIASGILFLKSLNCFENIKAPSQSHLKAIGAEANNSNNFVLEMLP